MLSVAIIARDEERHIGAALDSVAGLASEVVVLLDSRTRDGTATIAQERGARVIVEPWRGFSAQRNHALQVCGGEWVLFLDADERVTPELRAELHEVIQDERRETRDERRETRDERRETRDERRETRDERRETRDTRLLSPVSGLRSPVSGLRSPVSGLRSPVSGLRSPVSHVGYWIPRHNLFFGKTLRGGGWYPDHQLRLLRRGRARYDEARLVHELALLDGEAGYLSGHLLHLNIERLDELWRKQTSYALQEAQTIARAGGRARWRSFVGAPLREFHRRYVALGGWRDGAIGLLMCATLAYFELVKYVHLKGLERITFERSNT